MSDKRKRVKIFRSHKEENETEYRRRAQMTPQERLRELTAIQERAWGEDWTNKPIEKKVTWEEIKW